MAGKLRASLVLVCAVVALAGFAPTFVLVTLTSFGALGQTTGNALLLADALACMAALAAAVGAFRGASWWRGVAFAAALVAAIAGVSFLAATWPWSEEQVAVRNLAVLHAWTVALAILAWPTSAALRGERAVA